MEENGADIKKSISPQRHPEERRYQPESDEGRSSLRSG
jgi:hypothetical protein